MPVSGGDQEAFEHCRRTVTIAYRTAVVLSQPALSLREKATFCILRQPEMLHLETRIYFTLSSVVLYEFPQYEFPQAVRLYEFPQPVPVLDLASMVHVLQYR